MDILVVINFLSFFFFGAVLGFELRALLYYLRHSTSPVEQFSKVFMLPLILTRDDFNNSRSFTLKKKSDLCGGW
jgi:hypothetical protein